MRTFCSCGCEDGVGRRTFDVGFGRIRSDCVGKTLIPAFSHERRGGREGLASWALAGEGVAVSARIRSLYKYGRCCARRRQGAQHFGEKLRLGAEIAGEIFIFGVWTRCAR